MRITVLRAMAIAGMSAVAGCSEVMVHDSPKFVGMVVDADTGRPIEAAKMHIAPKNSGERIKVEDTPGGRFSIPPMENKIQVWLFESVQPDTVIDVWADRYEGQKLHTRDFPSDGVIRLKRRLPDTR